MVDRNWAPTYHTCKYIILHDKRDIANGMKTGSFKTERLSLNTRVSPRYSPKLIKKKRNMRIQAGRELQLGYQL